jgi:hypothetical protein
MSAVRPMLANGIDLPLLLLWGVAVFVPLMLFQVGVEGAILSRCWQIRFRELMTCVFLANCWSLLAGIPVKIFNAWLYSLMLPTDLAGFFARYPFAVTLGTLVYFFVTWLVEARYSMKRLEREGHTYFRSRVRSGVLLANLATYAVLGPVHYFATRPTHNIQEFTADTRWASQPPTQIIYIDTETKHLKSIFSDGSNPGTIVPLPVADYQVSADLSLCLFRGPDGFLYLYSRDPGQQRLVWQTTEQFAMSQMAFSPSGRLVAWFNEKAQLLEVANLPGTNRWTRLWTGNQFKTRLAWSEDELKFLVSTDERRVWMEVTAEGVLHELQVAPDYEPELLPAYGRVNWESFGGSRDEWGAHYHSDIHGDLNASTFPGYASALRLYRTNDPATKVVSLAVNPGLLRFPNHAYGFTHPSFLADGRECLIETPNDIYLLDIERKRIGRVTRGHNFIQFTPRYAKTIP